MAIPKRGIRLGLILLCITAAAVATAIIIKPDRTKATTSVVVPVEVVLLVDTSSSVDDEEYVMQRQGYANAFRDKDVKDAIEAVGGIAVLYVEWDRANTQNVRIAWTHLQTRQDCTAYGNSIQSITRESASTTMMAPALEFARNELMTNDFLGMRRVIDVSGDGECKNWLYYNHGQGENDPSHYGTPWDEVRATLTNTVHSVNGVFIGPPGAAMDFYEDVLPLGQDAFTLHAPTFQQFSQVIEEKLIAEITARLPGTYD
ncbi:MAG: DUF1194 domain-containing protein [Planctomycetota bacterium]|jgi:hypothetical protein